MNLLFFGDSLVAGENSKYSFTDCITKHRVQKYIHKLEPAKYKKLF